MLSLLKGAPGCSLTSYPGGLQCSVLLRYLCHDHALKHDFLIDTQLHFLLGKTLSKKQQKFAPSKSIVRMWSRVDRISVENDPPTYWMTINSNIGVSGEEGASIHERLVTNLLRACKECWCAFVRTT